MLDRKLPHVLHVKVMTLVVVGVVVVVVGVMVAVVLLCDACSPCTGQLNV